MTNPEHLATEIAKFRDSRRALQEMVVRCFPIGCKVRRRSTGVVGLVHCTVAGFPERLGILLENGNVWDYDATELERVA